MWRNCPYVKGFDWKCNTELNNCYTCFMNPRVNGHPRIEREEKACLENKKETKPKLKVLLKNIIEKIFKKKEQKTLTYKDSAICPITVKDTLANIADYIDKIENSTNNCERNFLKKELITRIVTDGDPEYDTIPEEELIQQHMEEVGVSRETEDKYLLWKLQMVKEGSESLYDIDNRKVLSIIRRRIGVPKTGQLDFKAGLALDDPFVLYAWNDKLNSCKELYTVKFYRADEKPKKDIPMEEYEYMDDKESAMAHFERFRNDTSLLYNHIDLTVISADMPERVLQQLIFHNGEGKKL